LIEQVGKIHRGHGESGSSLFRHERLPPLKVICLPLLADHFNKNLRPVFFI